MTQTLTLLNLFLVITVPLAFLNSSHSPFAGGKFIIFQLVIGLFFLSSYFLNKKSQIQVYNPFKSRAFQLGLATFATLSLYTYFSLTTQISLLGTLDRFMGLYTYSLLFIVFVLNQIFLSNTEKSSLQQKLFTTLNYTTQAIALYGLFQFMGMDLLIDHINSRIFQGRIFSFSGNPSYLGQLMCISSLYNLYQFQKHKKNIHFLIPQLTALILSQTRSSILGFILGSLIIYRKHIKKYLILTILILGFTLGANHQNILNSNSLHSRFEIWKSTIQLIQEKPFGHGIENIQTFFPTTQTAQFNILEDNIYKTADKIHNQTLSIIYSSGPLGLIIYLLIIIHLIKTFPTNQLSNTLILTNIFQNQFNFFDLPSLTILVLLFSLQKSKQKPSFQISKIYLSALIIIGILILNNTYQTFTLSQHYKNYKKHFNQDYQLAQIHLSQAIKINPHYSKLWMELGYSNLQNRLLTFENLNKLESPAPQSQIWLAKHLNSTRHSHQILTNLHLQNPHNPVWLLELLLFEQQNNLTSFQTTFIKFQKLIPHIWHPPLSNKAKTFIKNFPEYNKLTSHPQQTK